jgi:hypothetical protein
MPDARYRIQQPAHQSNQKRQSPVTDIATLTVLVLESYEQTFALSSPKVRGRYETLLRQLRTRR